MRYRKLGRSGLEVSAVAMGCWAISGGSVWGPQSEEDAIAAIETALQVGINFFDTAEAYGAGRSEQLLGKALRGRREQAVIASKVSPSHLHPADLKAACEASLRRLQSDYLDLYQIHWASRDVPIAEALGAMEELKAEGKIRVIGCSNFGPQDLTDLLGHGRAEVDQLAYNLLWRAVEYEIQPLCVQHAVSVLPYSPMAQGLLTGKFSSPEEVPEARRSTRHFSRNRSRTRHGKSGAEEETFEALSAVRAISDEIGEPMGNVALAWVLSRPAVPSVLAGARNAEQVRANARAAAVELSEDVLKRLTRATEPLKELFGTNPDMWQSDSRIR